MCSVNGKKEGYHQESKQMFERGFYTKDDVLEVVLDTA